MKSFFMALSTCMVSWGFSYVLSILSKNERYCSDDEIQFRLGFGAVLWFHFNIRLPSSMVTSSPFAPNIPSTTWVDNISLCVLCRKDSASSQHVDTRTLLPGPSSTIFRQHSYECSIPTEYFHVRLRITLPLVAPFEE